MPEKLIKTEADSRGLATQQVCEAALVAILKELLGLDKVERDDNLLLLGGESLIATQIASRIRDRFHIEVPMRSIMIGTISEIAAEILVGLNSPSPERQRGSAVCKLGIESQSQ